MMRIRTLAAACAAILALSAAAVAGPAPDIPLAHLNALKGTVNTPEGPLPIWHVYAEPSPDGYRPVEAAGEGIACVDDASRALLVYLDHYELTGDPASLAHARDAVRFLAYMRQADGTYANFVLADGSPNLTGSTSRPGVNWWMARAMWGLARAKAVFSDGDPEFAAYVDGLLAPSLGMLKAAALPSGRTAPKPRLVGGGADVTAIFLLAVSWLQIAEPSDELMPIASALAQGLLGARAGDAANPPYGAVMPNPGAPAVWTAWGHHAVEALALAGGAFGVPEWTQAAAGIAHSLATYLAAGPGALAGQGPAPLRYPQIAYSQAPLVRGLVTLYEATGSDLYADLAYLAASWLYGNNPANAPMFEPATGVVYDGIDGDGWTAPGRINYNSGAESTIEGLSMLLALARLPGTGLLSGAALRYVDGSGPLVVEAEDYLRPGFGPVDVRRTDNADGSRPSGGRYAVLHAGSQITLNAAVPPGTYRVHLVHGGARTTPAAVYVVAEDALIATLTVGRSEAGDRLRATDLGLWEWDETTDRLHIIAEGGSLAVDAVLLHPAVMWRRLQGEGLEVIAVRNMTKEAQKVALENELRLEASSVARVRIYDRDGKLVAAHTNGGAFVLPALGFALAVLDR